MDKHEDPFYMLEQKEKEMRDLLFSVLTENARLIEENKRLRKEKKGEKNMKSIKEIVGTVIDIALENIEADPEEWIEDDGRSGYDLNLSPRPELYSKLNQYFAEMYAGILLDVLKNHYGQKAVK